MVKTRFFQLHAHLRNCLAFHVDLVYDKEGVMKSKAVYIVHKDHQEDSNLMIHSERWYPFLSKVSWGTSLSYSDFLAERGLFLYSLLLVTARKLYNRLHAGI